MNRRRGGDLVVVSADVVTMDAARPRARAFAARAGRIEYVGDDAAAARAHAPGAPVLDLAGKTVTPGFIDAHTHLVHWARTRARPSFAGVRSLAGALDLVRAAHARLPAGQPLAGENVPPFEALGEAPTRAHLDAAAPGRVVVLKGRDLHSAWVSSPALAAAGITRATPDPAGGAIGRGPGGEPDGLLYESALLLLPPAALEDDPAALLGALAQLAACGITGVHAFGDPAEYEVLADVRDAGELTARVAFGFMVGGLSAAAAPPASPLGGADEFLWPFALKGFVDGTLGSRTAWMLAPYDDRGGTGAESLDAAGIDALAGAARARGLTLALHAIGDRAVRAALDAFERWPEAERARLRPRIEHAQLVHPDDVPRFGRLGVVASMQPVHAVTDRALAERAWGARDARGGYAWRALEDAGARLAFGSDVPIEDPDPRAGLWAAVTGADERACARGNVPARALALERAFAAFTTGAAFAAGREATQGRLAPGGHADFVAWAEDPFRAPTERLRDVPLDSTWLAGRRIWPPV